MRQNNDPLQQGKRARPSDRATTLAERLASIHPADLIHGAKILAEFAGSNMQNSAFVAPHGDTHSEAEEIASTIIAVGPSEFSGLVPDYLKLVAIVRAFLIHQGGNTLAVAQLDRIAKALAVDESAVIEAAPARRAGHWLKGKAMIVAAIALALLIWDITSDDLLLWQIVAAIGLVGCICGAAFRIGQRAPIQTPVATSTAVLGTTRRDMEDR